MHSISETKLTKKLGFEGFNTLQTSMKRRSGTALITSQPAFKAIKALGTSITWASVALHHVPIHFINVYITPQDKDNSDKTLEYLDHIINLIFERHSHSRVIISGDFNERLSEVTAIVGVRGLLPCIEAGTSTHSRGGHLDQVYSNVPCIRTELIPLPVDISDHTQITCTF